MRQRAGRNVAQPLAQVFLLQHRVHVVARPHEVVQFGLAAEAGRRRLEPKAGEPQQEWTLAIKNGKPFEFMGQFDYSAPLTELCLIGGLAMQVGKPIVWDSAKLQVVGMPEAQKFIKRAAYRKGWEYSSAKV